jgi:hypothetical protein
MAMLSTYDKQGIHKYKPRKAAAKRKARMRHEHRVTIAHYILAFGYLRHTDLDQLFVAEHGITNPSGIRGHLGEMVEDGHLTKQFFAGVGAFYMMTAKGRRFFGVQNFGFKNTKPSLFVLNHHQGIVDTYIYLAQKARDRGQEFAIMTEKEQEAFKSSTYLTPRLQGLIPMTSPTAITFTAEVDFQGKRKTVTPDLLVWRNGNFVPTVFEVELTPKTEQRYRDLMKVWVTAEDNERIDAVFYCVLGDSRGRGVKTELKR